MLVESISCRTVPRNICKTTGSYLKSSVRPLSCILGRTFHGVPQPRKTDNLSDFASLHYELRTAKGNLAFVKRLIDFRKQHLQKELWSCFLQTQVQFSAISHFMFTVFFSMGGAIVWCYQASLWPLSKLYSVYKICAAIKWMTYKVLLRL